MLNALRFLTAIAAVAGTVTAANAAEKSLSKSISDGWSAVVKDASKAARDVTKAADDALTPKKGSRKKSAKRKGSREEQAKEVEPQEAKFKTTKVAPEESVKSAEPRDEPAEAKTPPPPAKASVPRPEPSWSAKAEPPAVPKSVTSRIPEVDIVPIKPQPDGKGSRATQPPVTMIPPKQETGTKPEEKPAETPAATWSKDEIEAAKSNCAAILKRVDAVTIPEPPLRDGSCGTPAPVRLVSLGKNPEVALSPPPVMTCDLVAGLHDWMKNEIQPLAKKLFGAPVIKIETMSDYACRMAYGRKGSKLSEHGRANALDIRGFVMAKGETAYALEHWGKTVRDLAAEATAKAAEKAAADAAANAAAAGGAKSAIVQDKTKITVSLPTGAIAASSEAKLGSGNDKRAKSEAEARQATAPILDSEPRSKKSQFLHEAHDSACRIFGTTLGPEANDAHRNHFHVDMAPRTRTRICD